MLIGKALRVAAGPSTIDESERPNVSDRAR